MSAVNVQGLSDFEASIEANPLPPFAVWSGEATVDLRETAIEPEAATRHLKAWATGRDEVELDQVGAGVGWIRLAINWHGRGITDAFIANYFARHLGVSTSSVMVRAN